MDNVRIFDTTLRDGEQSPGATLTLPEKLEVARLLDAGMVDMGEAQLRMERLWAGALRRAVIDGDVEGGSVMAGQSVGMVTAVQSVAEILAELRDQAVAALVARAVG